MEKRFQIVTDSSCDLPQALADELDLAVLPLHVLIGEHTYANYLDGREIGFREFYDKLRDGERATTSAVNVSEFTAVMEEKLKAGLDILFLGFSSGLSTTYQSGAIACGELREKYPERKLIAIDSLCASLGEGLLLYLAAKKQQSGASIDEVADYVRETIPHLCHWFTVNDLMFLKRGGRVDAATALVGTVLQIKPVMHTDDAGTLKNVTKARGRKAALKALAQKLADTAINPAEQTVFICHGDCIEDAEYTAEQIRALTPVKDIIINYVGPVIGAHTGPGVISVFFVGTHRYRYRRIAAPRTHPGSRVFHINEASMDQSFSASNAPSRKRQVRWTEEMDIFSRVVWISTRSGPKETQSSPGS